MPWDCLGPEHYRFSGGLPTFISDIMYWREEDTNGAVELAAYMVAVTSAFVLLAKEQWSRNVCASDKDRLDKLDTIVAEEVSDNDPSRVFDILEHLAVNLEASDWQRWEPLARQQVQFMFKIPVGHKYERYCEIVELVDEGLETERLEKTGELCGRTIWRVEEVEGFPFYWNFRLSSLAS